MSRPSRLPSAYHDRRILAILGFLTFVILLFAYIHLVYPSLPVDTVVLGLLALLVFVWLFPFIKSLKLPGGVEITMEDALPLLEAAKNASQEVTPSLSVKMQAEVKAGPTWKTYIDSEPKAALGSLRIEVESKLAELMRAVDPRSIATIYSLTKVQISELTAKDVLTEKQGDVILKLLSQCNQALHADVIDIGTARIIGDAGELVLQLLDSKVKLVKSDE